MFPNLLSVFAATSAAGDTKNSTIGAGGMTEFPGEQPTDKELSDWLDAVGPMIRQQYGAILRGDLPVHLVELQHGADDLSGYVRIAVGSAEAGSMTAAQV